MQRVVGKMRLKAVTGIMLMLLLTGTLAVTFNIQQAVAVEPPATDWTRTYGGTEADEGLSLVVTSDGGYALAGWTTSSGAGIIDAWLVKVDSSGNHEWNKTYGGAYSEEAYSVVETSDGGYILAGFTNSSGAGYNDFWLVKVDSSGDHQWNRTYGGDDYDEARSVVETSDGGYALAGYTGGLFPDPDFWLVKVDSSGEMQWNKTYGGASADYARSVVETSDGGYVLTGFTNSFAAGYCDFWLVKADSSGNMEWNQTYGGTGQDLAWDVMVTGDGGYALLGYTDSSGAGNRDFWLVKVAGPTFPVGGIWIPVDKFGLLAPYIALVTAIILATFATAVFVKHKKKQ